jgi:hypothetical protein
MLSIKIWPQIISGSNFNREHVSDLSFSYQKSIMSQIWSKKFVSWRTEKLGLT